MFHRTFCPGLEAPVCKPLDSVCQCCFNSTVNSDFSHHLEHSLYYNFSILLLWSVFIIYPLCPPCGFGLTSFCHWIPLAKDWFEKINTFFSSISSYYFQILPLPRHTHVTSVIRFQLNRLKIKYVFLTFKPLLLSRCPLMTQFTNLSTPPPHFTTIHLFINFPSTLSLEGL